jgi:glyoxylase I family protein
MAYVTGFQVAERKAVLLDIGDGSYMELFSPSADTPTTDSPFVNDFTHLSFATTDARAAIEHVRQAGFEVTIEARDAQVGSIPATFAFFRGPNGELIEFFEVR